MSGYRSETAAVQEVAPSILYDDDHMWVYGSPSVGYVMILETVDVTALRFFADGTAVC